MKKIFLLLALVLFTFCSFSYADDKKTVRLDDFEITNPKEESTMIPNSNMVLTRNGKENDKLEIQVYSIKKTINKDVKDSKDTKEAKEIKSASEKESKTALDNKKESKEIVIKKLNNSYTLTVDALKIFAQDLELKEGENLIVINITRADKQYVYELNINYNKNMELNKIIRQLDYKDTTN